MKAQHAHVSFLPADQTQDAGDAEATGQLIHVYTHTHTTLCLTHTHTTFLILSFPLPSLVFFFLFPSWASLLTQHDT